MLDEKLRHPVAGWLQQRLQPLLPVAVSLYRELGLRLAEILLVELVQCTGDCLPQRQQLRDDESEIEEYRNLDVGVFGMRNKNRIMKFFAYRKNIIHINQADINAINTTNTIYSLGWCL